MPGGTSGAGVTARCQVIAAGGLTATVNGGQYQINRAGEAVYLGAVTGTVTGLTFAQSNPSNPRIDYVVIRVRDPGVDGNTITASAEVRILQGSPAANPQTPDGQLTDGDLLLAAVTIGAGATSITSISDRRVFVVARGGVGLKSASDSRPGSYEGDYRDNLATNGLERWSGTAWEAVASPAAWTQFTPTLYSSAGTCNLGPGGYSTGAYQLLGKNLRIRYYFEAKRPCNLGSGMLYTRLPNGLQTRAFAGDYHGRAQLNTQPPGGAYLTWIGDSACFGGSNQVFAYFNKTITDNTFDVWRVATTAGTPGNGIPQLSGEYPDPLRGMSMFIDVEVQ